MVLVVGVVCSNSKRPQVGFPSGQQIKLHVLQAAGSVKAVTFPKRCQSCKPESCGEQRSNNASNNISCNTSHGNTTPEQYYKSIKN